MWLSLNIILASCGYLKISFYKVVTSKYHPQCGYLWISSTLGYFLNNWAVLGSFAKIWAVSDIIRAIFNEIWVFWHYLGCFAVIWAVFDTILGNIWCNLGCFVIILAVYDIIRAIFHEIWAIWHFLGCFEIIWAILTLFWATFEVIFAVLQEFGQFLTLFWATFNVIWALGVLLKFGQLKWWVTMLKSHKNWKIC